jgi:hypothetical protein
MRAELDKLLRIAPQDAAEHLDSVPDATAATSRFGASALNPRSIVVA